MKTRALPALTFVLLTPVPLVLRLAWQVEDSKNIRGSTAYSMCLNILFVSHYLVYMETQ